MALSVATRVPSQTPNLTWHTPRDLFSMPIEVTKKVWLWCRGGNVDTYLHFDIYIIYIRLNLRSIRKCPRKRTWRGLLLVHYKASDVDPDGIATVKSFIVSQIWVPCSMRQGQFLQPTSLVSQSLHLKRWSSSHRRNLQLCCQQTGGTIRWFNFSDTQKSWYSTFGRAPTGLHDHPSTILECREEKQPN